jgi:hypothetical protein
MSLLNRLLGSESDEEPESAAGKPIPHDDGAEYCSNNVEDAYQNVGLLGSGVTHLSSPKHGWKYFAKGLLARVVIPAGATVVKRSTKYRTDELLIEEIFAVGGETTVFAPPVVQTERDAGVAPYSKFAYKEGRRYTVDEVDTSAEKCNKDGIYFFARKQKAAKKAFHERSVAR